MFSRIEGPEEQRLSNEVITKKAAFLAKFDCIDEKEFDELVLSLRDAWEFGLPVISVNETLPISSWDFSSSFFFSTTLLTTIGFGAVTPLTSVGKVACIFYTLFGIPLTFLFVGTLTYIITKPVRKLLDVMISKWESFIPELGIRLLHLLLLVVFVAGIFFIVPAVIFDILEPTWSFLDAIYFTFISLTTVGLGDFVPGFNVGATYMSQRAFYQIATSVYLIVGICMMFLIVEFCILIPTVGQIWDVVSPVSSRRNSTSKANEKAKLKESLQQLTEYSSIGGGTEN